MDQELKQRLIGAAVVTALAAIFIPMLFDDPVDNSARQISEMGVPKPPVDISEEAAHPLPDSTQDVLSAKPGAEYEPPSDLPSQELDSAVTSEPDSTEISVANGDESNWIEDGAGDNGAWQVVDGNGDTLDSEKPHLTDEEAMALEPTPANPPKTPKPASDTPSESQPIAKTAPKPLESKPKPNTDKSKSGLIRWYVQAGSFSKKENALALKDTLRKQGFPVFMETQSTSRGPMYRLKIGPELDKKRALSIKSKLSSQKISSIVLAE